MIQEHNNSTWQGKAYSKIVDTTQQVTSFPVVVRPMENTIPSWTINGNMVQDGTPTPSNPVDVNGVGVRTENLLPINNRILSPSNWSNANYYYIRYSLRSLLNLPNGKVTLSVFLSGDVITNHPFGFTKTYDGTLPQEERNVDYTGLVVRKNVVLQLESNDDVYIAIGDTSGITTEAKQQEAIDKIFGNYQIMVTIGENNPSVFEPYGYKIPISSGGVTTPVYLGEVQSTRRIKQLVLTGQESGWGYSTASGHYFGQIAIPQTGINSSSGNPRIISSHYVGMYDNENNIVRILGNGEYLRCYDDTNAINDTAWKTYLQQQYAAGTPVCVWYVLAEPTTGIVNEPLRKIGTYSDSVSGTNLSVTAHSPTAIDVDTSLKPSEMDLTYTGLKMCGRKKYAHGNSPQILPSAKAGSRTSGNMTLTCDGNGVYTLVGSPTPNAVITFDIPPTEIPLSVGEGGNGTLSLFNDSVYNNFDITFIYQGTPYHNAVAYRPNTLNKTSTTYGSNSSGIGGKTIISIGVRLLDYGDINCTFSPMITNDGQLPSTFQPYCSWQ